MQRLGRRSAADRVAARADRLSGDLLAVEVRCFAEIAAAFAAGVPVGVKAVRRRWPSGAPVGVDVALVDSLRRLMLAAMEDARASVAGLAQVSVLESLESIGDELAWCEETLARRYVGVAAQGVEAARSASQELATEAMRLHEAVEGPEAEQFALKARMQMAQSVDVDDMVRRLFSPDPVGASGLSGRGVWWLGATGLNASARNVSIGLSNAVREAAMTGMNAAAAAR